MKVSQIEVSQIVYALMFLTFLQGCAIKTETVPLYSPVPAEVLRCGDAMSVAIGIAPVADKRPLHEQTGQKPKGVYLGVWNQRIGDYITSDKDFKDNVVSAMTKQFAHAIEGSNCFYETKILEEKVSLQPGAEELLVAFANHKVRYVLISELLHFYGTQHQHSHVAVIPALVVNAASVANSVGMAQGFTEVLFTLYDTQAGQEVWRQKIETNSDNVAKGAYVQAAKDSLMKASEKLAEELSQYSKSLGMDNVAYG